MLFSVFSTCKYIFSQQKTEMLKRGAKSRPTNTASESLKVSFTVSKAGGQVAALEGGVLVVQEGTFSHGEDFGERPRVK